MEEKRIVAKLVGGPAHGKKMVLPSLEIRIFIPEVIKAFQLNVVSNDNIPIISHEYQLTNVEYKGVRYYKHLKLDAVKSKMLQKAFVESNYQKWSENYGL